VRASLRNSFWNISLLVSTTLATAVASDRESSESPRTSASEIRVLSIDGIINPASSRYLARELSAAQTKTVELIILELNTPGGLETAMRDMVTSILGSTVPVAVYVTPGGARAASAGMFITVAANFAAMAPGTNIGAAHPVGLGSADQDEVMADKVTQDAAALARSIANQRGRNAQWAEKAVLESVSLTASEAANSNVIDMVAPTRAELLSQINGHSFRTASGTHTVQVNNAQVVELPMNLLERILMVIIDPNIAYLLFLIGTIGLLAELYNPGMYLPGTLGVTSLVLALVSFGSLPINWAGILLLLLAIGLFIGELHTAGIGVLSAGALLCFLLGSLLLFSPFSVPSPSEPSLRINPWLIGIVAVAIAVFFLGALRALVRTRRIPITTGSETLVGRTGIAVSSLAPQGRVRLDSEEWTAESEKKEEFIDSGERVRVTNVRGVTLFVRKELPTSSQLK
jgi:membrane-bound serine protease (ClpP class)